MRIGTRVIRPKDVRRWDAEIYQVSMYRGWIESISLLKHCVSACRDKGVPGVVHPVGFSLLDKESFRALKKIAKEGGEPIILHDEKDPNGKRLSGKTADQFRNAFQELGYLVPLSFENAGDTHDAPWFWEQFGGSITLDIGHIEAAGLNSIEFVQGLPAKLVERIEYVHMHHNGTFRSGLTDHHPLNPDCRELSALETLVKRKQDVAVILEINETEMIDDSLGLLRDLRDRVKENRV
jgi:hypothetical protein